MEFEDYFRDKGCVVTGAASGIGLALSTALLQGGAVVFMADVNAEGLSSAVEGLRQHAGRVHPATVDVTNQEQVRQLIEDAASRHGRLDVLFNNAGIGATVPIEQVKLEQWRLIMDINLWSVIYGVHTALPIMRRQGGGQIVSTASLAGIVPLPFQALYCMTKHAVVGLSESLRLELADEGIDFSVVCPANVATAIFQGAPPADAIPADTAAETILAGVAKKEPIIVLPESARRFWNAYRTAPEATEKWLLDMAKERRESYRTKGKYY
jgi:NAD(P)-dependent dehydrogenase (short-subunit alcohol dehydrogenase family)